MKTYHINDFIALIAQLRNPKGGCPWDLKQNYQTMIPHLLEESYEVVEAITQKSAVNLKEELGDLLLQVVFLSQLATEEKKFNFDDVVNEVCAKIIRRHPHVFGDTQANNEQEALQNWNEVKASENAKKGQQSLLDNVPHAFPALLRAEKLQKKCATVGFDWDNVSHVVEKVQEELEEVNEELNKPQRSQEKIEEEVGDLLFAVTNLSRHLNVQPEEALRKANHKFERRFRQVEKKAKEHGVELSELSLIEMDMLWYEVKEEEKFL